MSSLADRRRSPRILLRVPVLVQGDSPGNPYKEETYSLVVNHHGGLILVSERVEAGQNLILKNLATKQEMKCHVVYVGPSSLGRAQVGVEFSEPSMTFWEGLIRE
jgi:hypothetical protein